MTHPLQNMTFAMLLLPFLQSLFDLVFIVAKLMQETFNLGEIREFSFSKKANLRKRFVQRWSPRGRPWPRGRPRGHILKSLALALASKVKSLALALASKPQVLENWPVLGSRTALFFEQLKFCWKTQETSQKTCEHLFCFPHLEHKRSQGEGGRGSAPFPIENSPMTKCDKKA